MRMTRTRTRILLEEEQMTAAQTKPHEEKHIGIRKGKKIVLKASIGTKLPVSVVSATKPSRDLATRSAISYSHQY